MNTFFRTKSVADLQASLEESEGVLDVVRKTRPKDAGVPPFVKELVEWGAGPRACQQWVLGGKVRAIRK